MSVGRRRSPCRTERATRWWASQNRARANRLDGEPDPDGDPDSGEPEPDCGELD